MGCPIDERVEQEKGIEMNDGLEWVETFLADSKDLISFPLDWVGLTDEDKNIFIRRYVETVTVLDGKVLNLKFICEVEKLLAV